MSDRPSNAVGDAPQAEEIRRPTRLHALILYLIAAAGLIVCSLFSGVVELNLINLIYYLLFFAAPIIFTIRKTGIEAFRPNPVSLRSVFAVALLALNGVLLANNLTVLWAIPFQKLGLDVNVLSTPAPENVRALMIAVLAHAVVPAVCEEFLFRGAMLSAFERGGTRRAILFSTALFALLHGSLIGLPTHFLCGLLIAFVVVCTDSLYAGMIYHTIHNATSLLLQYMQEHSAAPDAEVVTDFYAAIGGAGGILTLVVEIVLSAGIMLMLLRLFRLRAQLHKVPLTPDEKQPMQRSEWLILIAALICTAALFLAEILAMLGGLS